ncbi:hypothetical protein ACFXG4_03760 [Nocardia sp. NPDC059246]|uniref:hypothetical protein n=1 Tax=unclassified Nocardia TaxID=2637762 RepID=UPI00368E9776
MTIWTDVAEFSRAFDVAILDSPGWPADEDVDLALRLIAEEVAELCAGLEARDMVATADGIVDTIYVTAGLGLRVGCIPRKLRRVGLLTDVRRAPCWEGYDEVLDAPRPRNLADFCARLVEVANERDLKLTSAYIALLINACLVLSAVLQLPLKSLWKEVHASNMRKLVDGKVIRDEGGKVLKPAGWSAPDVAGVLASGGWEVAV